MAPKLGDAARVQVQDLGHGFWRAGLHFGFMETPDVPAALQRCAAQGLRVPTFQTSYFLSRETVVARPGGALPRWRRKLFAAMARNAGSVAGYFRLPDNAVVELGARVPV